MKSVADALRAQRRTAETSRSTTARLRDGLALGERDARLLSSARGVSVDEARRLLARQRQQGRRRSISHESLFE